MKLVDIVLRMLVVVVTGRQVRCQHFPSPEFDSHSEGEWRLSQVTDCSSVSLFSRRMVITFPTDGMRRLELTGHS